MWLIQVYSCLLNDPRTLLLSFMVDEQHAFILNIPNTKLYQNINQLFIIDEDDYDSKAAIKLLKW
jgi:hypothetical protein